MPEIFLKTPVVQPAVPEVTYDQPWFLNINIDLAPGTLGRATVISLPWNQAENKHDLNTRIPLEITGLLPRLGSDPDFLTLWNAMVAYIKKEMIAQDIVDAPEPESP